VTPVRLPGLVDVHVHLREPGQAHKEDWSTGTAAALAGGFTTVLAMPNTDPPVGDEDTLDAALTAARRGARCDYAHYAGATVHNAGSVAELAPRTAGLKLYLNDTFGDLRLPDMELWWRHLESWPGDVPLVAHAEGPSAATMILMAEYLQRPVHLCHVSRRDEILLIRRAKERGVAVTCEATPHHLFLDAENTAGWGPRAEVRPRLAAPTDRAALWEHLEVIDCFATDHAPHTAEEKAGDRVPPGFPGLETAVGLLLGAVHEGLLAIDDLAARLAGNPRRIFGLPAQADTFTEVDPDARWTVRGAETRSKCRWTPFEGMELRGRVTRVEVRGEVAFDGDRVVAAAGTGRNLRDEEASR
jgi:carbamoyl-phosphate synthase/aspartate carbamoyltransferase/dihydroorotase